MIDFDQALLDPASVFAEPAEVVTCDSLTREQKIEVLRHWEYDAREMSVAEEENMPAPAEGAGARNADLLTRVLDALNILQASRDVDNAAPTKHGGL